MTLTIDLYNIESTGRAIIPGFQDVVNRFAAGSSLPGEEVIRDANGEIVLLKNAFQNSGSQKARGVDFGVSYQVETQFGTLTWLTQATWLDSFQFAVLPGEPEKELRSRGHLNFSTGSDDEGFLKWRANSQIDWAWKGFDLGLTVHYLDGFHEKQKPSSFLGMPYPNGFKEHYVKETWFFNARASYTFLVPSAAQAVAGYAKDTNSSGKQQEPEGIATAQMANCAWQRLLNDTTITLGCNNGFGHDPPAAAGVQNYADFLYDSTGRFVYVSLTKKF